MPPNDMNDGAFEVETEEPLPLWMILWGRLIHTFLSTFYFLLISLIAIGIDLGIHWLDKRQFVELYGMSSIIKWEVELMAYTLATADCLLFLWQIIKPVVELLRSPWQ